MIQWMQIQLERLRYFPIDDDKTASEAYQIPPYKLSTIRQYRNALVTAMTEALKYLGVQDPDKHCSSNDDNVTSSCTVSYRYDDLSFVPDDTDYNVDTCDTDVSLNFENSTKINKPDSQY